MFQSAALKHKLSKQAYAEQEPKMREKLLHAQLELAEKKTFAMVILVAGIDGAGKVEAIATIGGVISLNLAIAVCHGAARYTLGIDRLVEIHLVLELSSCTASLYRDP